MSESSDSTAESSISAPAIELAQSLVHAAGGSVTSVLLYGSHLLRANPDRHSAIDLVVIVDDYRRFYSSMRAAGELGKPVWLMTGMSHVLPPNVVAYMPGEGDGGIAKCLVVNREHLSRALGPHPKDHFLLARLVQRVECVYARSLSDRRWIEWCLVAARGRVLDWMAPFLEGPVNAEGLGRRLLEVCYQGELRPEAADRSNRIFDAQSEHFAVTLHPVLAGAAADGRMVEEAGRYRWASAVRPEVSKRWLRHFRRSKVRATARWFKHMLTFDNWLPYVVRKVERHSGKKIQLTRLERALPLIFLWPRAFHVLMTRPSRQVPR